MLGFEKKNLESRSKDHTAIDSRVTYQLKKSVRRYQGLPRTLEERVIRWQTYENAAFQSSTPTVCMTSNAMRTESTTVE